MDFSDLFDEDAVAACKRLRSRDHDVLVVQLLDREELEFPFEDPTKFLSMEDGREVEALPGQIRESYLTELKAYLDHARRELASAGIEHQLVITDEAPDRALLKILRRRESGAG